MTATSPGCKDLKAGLKDASDTPLTSDNDTDSCENENGRRGATNTRDGLTHHSPLTRRRAVVSVSPDTHAGDIPASQQARFDEYQNWFLGRGWEMDESYTTSYGATVTIGTRVRLSGEQYQEARERGTGNIAAIFRRKRKGPQDDIELVVVRGEGLAQVADYHVQVVNR